MCNTYLFGIRDQSESLWSALLQSARKIDQETKDASKMLEKFKTAMHAEFAIDEEVGNEFCAQLLFERKRGG